MRAHARDGVDTTTTIEVCCLQEVRWRGQGAKMLGMKGKRYRLWCSGTGDVVGGVGVMVNEKLCVKRW